jgi:hypothetical protein
MLGYQGLLRLMSEDFSVRTTMVFRYPKIECKFELSQKQKDHNNNSNLYFLETIAEFLLTVVKTNTS